MLSIVSMQAQGRLFRLAWLLLGVAVQGCVHRPPVSEGLTFGATVISGDSELSKLNEEELFAAATSFLAAQDYAQAARYFDRLCDAYPEGKRRRFAQYNAGVAHSKLNEWEDAFVRFSVIADPINGERDAVDASFGVAESLYNLERYEEAIDILKTLGARKSISYAERVKARTQQGICEINAGRLDAADETLRAMLSEWEAMPDRRAIGDYYPAQAQFFLGELYRLHYESVELGANKSAAQLAEDLEYKSQLLLSAQGHYLRTVRIGNGYWATAAGQRIGALYENMYDSMLKSAAPADLNGVDQDAYRAELRKKIRVLISKAISMYERTLEAAERTGASGSFVRKTTESLQRMRELMVAEAKTES